MEDKIAPKFPALVAFVRPQDNTLTFANLQGWLGNDGVPVKDEEEVDLVVNRVENRYPDHRLWGLVPVSEGIRYYTEVSSESNDRRSYTVTEDAVHGWACGCKDYLFRRRCCKHIMVAKVRFKEMVLDRAS